MNRAIAHAQPFVAAIWPTSRAPRPLTREQVKKQFHQRGVTITQWATEHGYRVNAVYRVLNGFDKGSRGTSHEIALALGMKLSVEQFLTTITATA